MFRAARDGLEQNRKAIAAEDGEHNAQGLAVEFRPQVGGDGVHRGVVPLRPRDDRFGNAHHILVTNGKPFGL